MKWLLIPILASVLFMCGCSSSSSGGKDAPAADYSGRYIITYGWEEEGYYYTEENLLDIKQDRGDVSLSLTPYVYNYELVTELGYVGMGKVKGRKMDVTWQEGAFTRLEFSIDGTSFSAYGDISFAGIKYVETE